MFIAVVSKFHRHRDLRFCTENDCLRCVSSCIVFTSIVSKSEICCQGRSNISSVIRKVPPLTSHLLVLGFDFTVSSGRMSGSGLENNSQIFCPIHEISVNKSSASIAHNRLEDSKRKDPFLDRGNCSLGTSVINWVHQ